MVAEGVLREGDQTFLWDGEVYTPMAEGPPHRNALENLRQAIGSRLPLAAWTIDQCHPLDLEEGFLPQPDLKVLRGPRSAYRDRTPRPPDVALLIEVSNTTYVADSVELLRKYAQASIPQYWIVNIRARTVEVYTDPDAEGRSYRNRGEFGLDAEVPLGLSVEGAVTAFEAVPVRDVLQDSITST